MHVGVKGQLSGISSFLLQKLLEIELRFVWQGYRLLLICINRRELRFNGEGRVYTHTIIQLISAKPYFHLSYSI